MTELFDFSLDTENAEKNYCLAQWYENQGHTAPAHTYYLRAAERSDTDLAYRALIRASFCYKKQGSRDGTEKVILENALMLIPKRPEAYYFLSLLYERKQEWQNAYIYSSLGLECYDREVNLFDDIPEYSGKHLLIFQKAVAAWWWGKGIESRKLFQSLVNEYWEVMDETHKTSVENNIAHLGSGPDSQSSILYHKKNYSKLRFKFTDSDKIENNFSQVYQDMFILSMLNGKRNGTFLEVGGADPFKGNNTALLEKNYDWKGVSLEYDEKFIENYRNNRSAKLFHTDALTVNYKKLLNENFDTKEIDYLQLDIEPARNTFEVLLAIPFDEYKFAVITYEHDYYVDVTKSYRDKSRKYLRLMGYELVVNDISPDGISNFEDWWVHPDLVDPEIIKIMKSTTDKTKKIDDYFLSTKYYAEFETDKYIRENFFPDQTYKGVFVEVGAGPPEFLSNSKHFRDCGWRTVCVEPNPKFVKQHQECESEVYQYACCNSEGKSNFVVNHNNDNWYTSENDGVSFSALDIRYKNVPEHNTQKTIEVETIKLNTLLEKIKVEKVDALSIDTEGWELDVMDGFDVSKYNPKVIVLENFEENSKYQTYMETKGYEKKLNLGYNQIYVRKK